MVAVVAPDAIATADTIPAPSACAEEAPLLVPDAANIAEPMTPVLEPADADAVTGTTELPITLVVVEPEVPATAVAFAVETDEAAADPVAVPMTIAAPNPTAMAADVPDEVPTIGAAPAALASLIAVPAAAATDRDSACPED